MSDHGKIRNIYTQVRLFDDSFHELIRQSNDLLRDKGRWALHRDMGVSENVIDALDAIRSFPYFECTERQENDDREEYDLRNVPSSTSTEFSVEEAENNEPISSHDEAFIIISEEIRQLCDAFGTEMQFDLTKVAKCLLRLGTLYTEMAINEIGSKMDQKLNFIRAAVLINAAVVRLRLSGREDDLYSSIQQLRDFHQKMLRSSVSTHNGNFVEFSENIKEKLEKLRANETGNLNKLKRIRLSYKHTEDMNENEKTAISEVRLLTTNNSSDYKDMMVEVIEKCLQVMGDPPCEFAIVGLGSLARKEITLSSDFEHVIILENGAPDTEEVREYFRWFTVIFHVIIIGLGETIVPSVDIKGLCDHYTVEDESIWFRDEYTPCGLSFDGMMPHACKCPLGRQIPTRNRSNVVELIQTAHKMADYLTKDEQLRNGYMLNDVLGTSCFVFGDKSVYDSFRVRSLEIQQSLTAEEIFEEKRDLLTQAAVARYSNRLIHSRHLDVKKLIYRPITVLLHYLAADSGIRFQNSFDILDELKERQIISDESHHTLCHALGIVLEIRIRCYQTRHRQRNIIADKDLADLVGDRCAGDCETAITFLLSAVHNMTYRRFILHTEYDQISIPSRESDIWHLLLAEALFRYQQIDAHFIENILILVKELIEQYKKREISLGRAHQYMQVHIERLKLGLYQHLGGSRGDQMSSSELIDIYEWSCDVDSGLTPDITHRLQTLYSRAAVLYNKDNFQEADRYLEMCLDILADDSNPVSEGMINGLSQLETALKRELLNKEESVEYFKHACQRQKNTLYAEYLYKCEIGRSLIQSDKSNGYQFLRDIFDEVKLNSKLFKPNKYLLLMRQLGEIFMEFGYQTVYFSSVLAELVTASELKLPGTNIGQDDQGVRVNNSQHFKYTFGRRYNIGRHANFTFNSSHREEPLRMSMWQNNFSHAMQVFSSVTYDDMITLITYVMNDPLDSSMPVVPGYECLTTAIALMALCENVKISDITVFEDLLRSTSTKCRKIKILQPFVYASLKYLSPHSASISPIMSMQNFLFKLIFKIPVHSQSHPYTLAASHFMSFDFLKSIKLIWKILHSPDTYRHDIFILEYFLTNVMTVMISRKREDPLMHLAKCREISLKQSLYYQICVTQGQDFVDDYLLLSYYYIGDTIRYALCYNLAVDFLVFDQRSCCALVWKLLHSKQLCPTLYQMSVSLLLESFDRVCELIFEYPLISRY